MAETQTDGGEGGGTAVAVATGREYPDNIREIGDLMAKLTGQQAKDLRGDLEDRGIVEKGMFDYDSSAVNTGSTEVTAVAEEKTSFDVVLAGLGEGAKKMDIIKETRALVPALGLKEAKDAVEGSAAKPLILKETQPKADAEALQKKLTELGAKIELR